MDDISACFSLSPPLSHPGGISLTPNPPALYAQPASSSGSSARQQRNPQHLRRPAQHDRSSSVLRACRPCDRDGTVPITGVREFGRFEPQAHTKHQARRGDVAPLKASLGREWRKVGSCQVCAHVLPAGRSHRWSGGCRVRGGMSIFSRSHQAGSMWQVFPLSLQLAANSISTGIAPPRVDFKCTGTPRLAFCNCSSQLCLSAHATPPAKCAPKCSTFGLTDHPQTQPVPSRG